MCTRVTGIILKLIRMKGIGNITVSAEFNFHCDPEAAYVVLQNTKCPTYIASWELCLHRAKLDWVEFEIVLILLINCDFNLIFRIGGLMFTEE